MASARSDHEQNADDDFANAAAQQQACMFFESPMHFKSFDLETLANLTVITARNVGLRDLDTFAMCSQLVKLDVSNNQITNLQGIYYCVALFELNLANNDLGWTEVERITQINIALLSLHGNLQLECDEYYREQLVDGMKNVWMLDGIWITAAEKAYVKRFFHLSTFSGKAVHRRFADKVHFVPSRLKNESNKVLTAYGRKVLRQFSTLEEHTLMLDRKRLTFVLEVYSALRAIAFSQRTEHLSLESLDLLEQLIRSRKNAASKFDTLCLLLLCSVELGKLNTKMLVESLHEDGIHRAVHQQLAAPVAEDVLLRSLVSLFLLPREARCQLISLLFACSKIEYENATFRQSAAVSSLFDNNVQLFNAAVLCLSFAHRTAAQMFFGRALGNNQSRSRLSSARSRKSPEMKPSEGWNGFALLSWPNDSEEEVSFVKSGRSSASPRRRPATSRITSAYASSPSLTHRSSSDKTERLGLAATQMEFLKKHEVARFVLANWLLSYLQQSNASFLEYVAHDEVICTLYNLVHSQESEQESGLMMAQTNNSVGKNFAAESSRQDFKSASISPTRVRVKGFPLPAEPHCFVSAESLHLGLPAPPSDVEVEGLDIEEKKPKLGQNVLLNTLTIGQITAIPESKVMLVRLTTLPDAPQFGSISRRLIKSPGYHAARHFMYVNCRNFTWDNQLRMWRPRGTKGDKFSLHYATKNDSSATQNSWPVASSTSVRNAQPKFRLIDLYGAPSMSAEERLHLRCAEGSQALTHIRKQQISDQLQLLHLPAILQSSASRLLDMLPADLQEQILTNKLSLLDLATAAEQAVKQARIAELRKAKLASKADTPARTVLPVNTLTFHLIDQEVSLPLRRTIVGSYAGNSARSPRKSAVFKAAQ